MFGGQMGLPPPAVGLGGNGCLASKLVLVWQLNQGLAVDIADQGPWLMRDEDHHSGQGNMAQPIHFVIPAPVGLVLWIDSKPPSSFVPGAADWLGLRHPNPCVCRQQKQAHSLW